MRFIANDGKAFDNLADAEKYEKELESHNADREKREKELAEARKKYLDLADKFYKDYGEEISKKYKLSNDDPFTTALLKLLMS